MKLKNEFILHDLGSSFIMVSAEKQEYPGMLRLNKVAAFIASSMKEETTEERLAEAVLGKYNATPEEARESVELVVEKLRSVGAIDE